MGASLNEQCRVSEEGLRIVKLCCGGKREGRGNDFFLMVPRQKVTCRVSEEGLRIVKLCCGGKREGRVNDFFLMVPRQKVTANYVPAAAVIRRWQALSGFIGRKASAGGCLGLM